MRKVIILLSMLGLMIMVVGCGAEENTNTNEQPNNVTEKENNSHDDKQNNEVNEAEENEVEVEKVEPLTTEEAQELVFDHFLIRLVEMDKLMDVVYDQEDYQLVFDETTEAYEAFERQILEVFKPLVMRKNLKETAELYGEMYTCECDSFSRITPNMVNVNFELLDQSADEFTVSFNELGDELDPTHGQYIVTFEQEDEEWKYADAEFKEHTNEEYGLTAEDVSNYGFNFANFEIQPMEFIEKRTIDGVEVLVFESYGSEIAYEVDSGAMDIISY